MDVDSDNDGNSVQGEEELMTAGEVLMRLQKSWINEKIAPELLIPLTEEVDCMIDQLKTMEETLSRCQPKENIIKQHKMEIERIRFLIAGYLRTRLAKIQKYAWFTWETESKRPQNVPSRLMDGERKFLKEYLQVVEVHLTTVGLEHMPPPFKMLPVPALQGIAPNLDSFVFCRVNRPANVTVENVEETEETEISLNAGSQYIMKYRPLSNLIQEDVIQLV